MAHRKLQYPTARHTGDEVDLTLTVNGKTVAGHTVGDFLLNTIAFIDRAGLLDGIELPFSTSGANNLLAQKPQHPDGRAFNNSLEYHSIGGTTLYINTNHPRFFALRQGARLLEAAGFKNPVPTKMVRKEVDVVGRKINKI